jgi:protein-tyrosine phosphatase
MFEPGDVVRWIYGRILGKPMNFSFIDDYVSASARPFSQHEVDWLKRSGVQALLSLTEDPINKNWIDGLDYKNVPMVNHAIPTVFQLQESVDFLVSERGLNHKTDVHCFIPSTVVGSSLPTPINRIFGYATSGDGEPNRIVKKFERFYNGPVLQIRSRGTLPITCTPEHPFLIYRPHREPKGYSYKPNWIGKGRKNYPILRNWDRTQPIWVLARDLVPGDFLLSPLVAHKSNPEAKIRFEWKSDNPNSNKVVEPFASVDVSWLMGLYAADGSSIGSRVLQLTLGKNDNVDRVLRAFGQFGVQAKVEEHENYTRIKVYSRTLTYNFRNWFGTNSLEKRLPEFLNGSDSRAVLEGVTDGDAYYSSKRESSSFFSTSLTLAFQVWNLALENGWHPYIRQFKRHSGFERPSPAWIVEWREKSTFHYTALWSNYYCMPVVSVEESMYSGLVYNLEIENNHTYLANGAIVHNCAAGKGRTGTVLAAYLCKMYELSPNEAISKIRSKRHGSIEKKQEKAVISFYEELKKNGEKKN